MALAVGMTAQMVGTAFVTQYYNVLHQCTPVVYRFYTDASHFTRADLGTNGVVRDAKGQAEIHELVMSGGYEGCKAEIKTVDSQESLGGSVLVVVTGVLYKSSGKQNFVQSFFLAPQERGYFVLNDILRYLDDEPQLVEPAYQMVNSAPMAEVPKAVPSSAEHEQREFSHLSVVKEETAPREAEICDERSTVNVDASGIDDMASFSTLNAISVEGSGPVQHSIADDLSFNSLQVSDSGLMDGLAANSQLSVANGLGSASFQEISTAKKSYASILLVQRDNHGVDQPPVASSSFQQAAVKAERPSQFQQVSKSVEVASHVMGESAFPPNEGDAKSVYIKNLPAGITESQLEDELETQFGHRPYNVLLRSNKDGGLYAFVDYETSAFADSVIQASPIMIGGRRAYIEERKSTPVSGGGSRGRGRGRGQDRDSVQTNGARAYGNGSSLSNGSRTRTAYGNGRASARSQGTQENGDGSNRGPGFRAVRSAH